MKTNNTNNSKAKKQDKPPKGVGFIRVLNSIIRHDSKDMKKQQRNLETCKKNKPRIINYKK